MKPDGIILWFPQISQIIAQISQMVQRERVSELQYFCSPKKTNLINIRVIRV